MTSESKTMSNGYPTILIFHIGCSLFNDQYLGLSPNFKELISILLCGSSTFRSGFGYVYLDLQTLADVALNTNISIYFIIIGFFF